MSKNTNNFSFKTNYSSRSKKGLDYSDPYRQTYVELLPFTKGSDGKWLNDTSTSKFVEGDKINVDEQIQTYKDSVDIYKIIEKFELSGDESLINKRPVYYYDISDMPTSDGEALQRLDILIADFINKEKEAAANKEKEAAVVKEKEAAGSTEAAQKEGE